VAYSTKELSPRTYADFERLASKGGKGSCWCTAYQRAKPLKKGLSREERRRANRKFKGMLVREGRSHAALVYDGKIPVGWCQYGTQDELPRIDKWRSSSRLKYSPPSGEERLWRITCFYVDRKYREKGVAKEALRAALMYIQKRGVGVVEAYPVVSKKVGSNPEMLWFGTPGMFKEEGFEAVAPLGSSLVLMRKKIPK
jgi:ribosomal protein S18 acetylase RimI-like enzyme